MKNPNYKNENLETKYLNNMQKNQFFKVKKIRIKKNFDRIET